MALPKNPRELFNPALLEAYDNNVPFWFLDALAENSVSDWTPAAPVRIYFGEDDLDVLPEEARRVAAAMNQRGANVEAIPMGPYAHEASALHGIPRALRWFTEITSNISAD